MVKSAAVKFKPRSAGKPDVVNVVRVIVPGLQHFYRRFGPGRLYDIPVKLGWLDRPRLETELTPFLPHT
jgi:ribosomal protein S12 methylthiotransferase accessory factor